MSLTGENRGEQRRTEENRREKGEGTRENRGRVEEQRSSSREVEFVCVGVRLLLCVELDRAL